MLWRHPKVCGRYRIVGPAADWVRQPGPGGWTRATAAGLFKVSTIVLGRTLEFPWDATVERGVFP